MTELTVSQAIEQAKRDGYKRIWLTNDFAFLRADVAISGDVDWQNSGIGTYMIREYSDAKVKKQLANPYQKEKTLMIDVEDNEELSKSAREKYRADIEERRGEKNE